MSSRWGHSPNVRATCVIAYVEHALPARVFSRDHCPRASAFARLESGLTTWKGNAYGQIFRYNVVADCQGGLWHEGGETGCRLIGNAFWDNCYDSGHCVPILLGVTGVIQW